MSSAIGHCVAALGIAEVARPAEARLRVGWVAALCVVACAPDVDYLLSAMGYVFSARVTHSILAATALPVAAVVLVRLLRASLVRTRIAVALLAAGLSHLILDLLVGVIPLPVFWPFLQAEVSLPFGVLPCAGAVQIGNPYLYRNLLIELGVIVPIVAGAFLARRTDRKKTVFACACASIPFMVWAACLAR